MQAPALPLGHVALRSNKHLLRALVTRTDNGADDRVRTGDSNLGKVVLYQLSHVRVRASLVRTGFDNNCANTKGSCPERREGLPMSSSGHRPKRGSATATRLGSARGAYRLLGLTFLKRSPGTPACPSPPRRASLRSRTATMNGLEVNEMTEKRSMKDRGEDAAAAYLEPAGIAVVERRWSCEVGRIDVVAWDGDVLADK